MSHEREVELVASKVLARVAAGGTLSYKLCQDVAQGSTVRPGVVLFKVVELLSCAVRADRDGLNGEVAVV